MAPHHSTMMFCCRLMRGWNWRWLSSRRLNDKLWRPACLCLLIRNVPLCNSCIQRERNAKVVKLKYQWCHQTSAHTLNLTLNQECVLWRVGSDLLLLSGELWWSCIWIQSARKHLSVLCCSYTPCTATCRQTEGETSGHTGRHTEMCSS